MQRLQEIGYPRIALGGLVPLKIDEIVACLEAVHKVGCPTRACIFSG